MAECSVCSREMSTATSCIGEPFPTGLAALPYQPDYEVERCHDCAIKPGGFHHPGCDMERCPKCGGQAISCDCFRGAP